jgi:CheY-like chemotaxis protein
MPTPKILLVDDTKLFLELEKNFLKFSSAHVLTACNGMEALDIIRKEKPDLVFMDLHMPQMDGAACCAALKADPALRSIPVIMVTSAGKEEDIKLCTEAGCDDFLTKPVDRRLFLEKGRKFLRQIDRRETRVPCHTAVKFKVHNLHLSGVSADISRKGIYVATEYEIGAKTHLELSFTLPESDCALNGIKGQIAWLNSKNNRLKQGLPVGFGVEFTNVPEEKAEIICAFLAASQYQQLAGWGRLICQEPPAPFAEIHSG